VGERQRQRFGARLRAIRAAGRASTFERLVREGRISVGIGTYGEPTVHAWDPGPVTRLRIGRYCSIAKDVTILLGGEHRPEWVTTHPLRIVNDLPGAWEDGHPATKGDITIGNDVWVGLGSTILSGVTIGDGAVIGAGSVVTSDVPAYAVAAGNPARVLRPRFRPEIVDALERIAWWRWSRAQILDAVDLLCSEDVEAFVERFDPGHDRAEPGPAG